MLTVPQLLYRTRFNILWFVHAASGGQPPRAPVHHWEAAIHPDEVIRRLVRGTHIYIGAEQSSQHC